MARSVRSKRRLRNQRVQAEKLSVYNKKVLDGIIEKREEHFNAQAVDGDSLNIPEELRALNKNQAPMVVEKEEKEKTIEQEDDESEDEDMDKPNPFDSKKVKKTEPGAILSHKENKAKYVKLFAKRQKAKRAGKKITPII